MPRIVRVPGLAEPLSFPSGTPDAEIYSAVIDKLFPVEAMPEIPKPEAGFFGGFGEGISALGGVPSALGYAVSPDEESRKAAAEAATPDVDFQQLSDIEGIGGLGRFFREQLGQSLGFMAVPVASAKAASMLPLPLPLKAGAAAGAFLTTAGAQYLGQTIGRQAQEQEIKAIKGEATEAPSITNALLAAGGQAGLDLYGFRLFKPLGDLIGLSGREASEQAAKELVGVAQKEGTEAAARSLLGGAARGAAIEAAQEPIQQLLERFGAGLDLSSDEAMKEYFEAAVAGGLLGAPIGGTSTFIGNLNAGVYDKKFDPDMSAEQFKSAWDTSKNEIYDQAPVYQFADDMGNFVQYTPEVLTRLGINPEIESLNLEKRSLDVKNDILGKSTEDRQIAGFLYNLFLKRKQSIDRELRGDAEDLTPDRRQELVAEYEQAVAGEKSMYNLLVRQPDVNSPRNFAVVPSPKDPKKFAVANMVTGVPVSETAYKTKEDAEKYISNQRKREESQLVKSVKETTTAAAAKPTPPATTPSAAALKEPDPFAVEKKAEVPPIGPSPEAQAYQTRIGDVQKAFGENASRVFEKAKEYEDAGFSKIEALNAAEKDVTAEITADAEAAAEAIETPTPPPPTEAPTTPPPTEVPTTPTPPEVPTTPPPPQLTPEQQVAAEAQALAEDYGRPGIATAVQTQEDLDAVKDYLAEVERLEGEVVREKAAKRPTVQSERRVQDMYDRLDSAVEAGDLTPIKPLSTQITPEQLAQIRGQEATARAVEGKLPSPVEDIDIDTLSDAELDAYLADAIKKMPKTSAEVDDIIEQNGNAKESKKIAKEVKSDICKGGSDA
jgi:hypothetical protein